MAPVGTLPVSTYRGNPTAETDSVAEDAVSRQPVSSLQKGFLQGDFDEMQGEPIQFLAEIHYGIRD